MTSLNTEPVHCACTLYLPLHLFLFETLILSSGLITLQAYQVMIVNVVLTHLN